jgi:hypothetical protein
MSFEDRLRDDLHAVPVPALRVPDQLADRVLAAARRQTRMRAGAVVGLAALAVASAVPALRGVLPGGGGPAPGTPACAVDAPLPDRPPAPNWEYLDPLKYEIDASHITGYRVASYHTSSYFQVLELTNPTRDRLVTVTLYAADGVPHHRTTEALPHPIDPGTGEPAEPVHGAPAYWLPETTYAGLPQGQGLAWQWAPGAWVLVTVNDTSGDADGSPTPEQSTVDSLRSLAAEIAPLLEFGAGFPVAAPFSMTVPDCTRVAATTTTYDTRPDGTPVTRFGVRFETQDAVAVTNPLLIPGDTSPSIGVEASWASGPEDKPGSAMVEVDGHPAALSDCPDADRCDPDTAYRGVIYEVNGFALELTGHPDLGVSVLDLYEAVEFHPGATHDPATWGLPISR